MKKIKILVASLLIGSVAYAQLPPLGNSGISTDWKRGGNNLGGGNPPDANIFGTFYNSPIYTYTNGVARMIVNGTFTPTILGVPTNTSGYTGIGNFGGLSPLGNSNIGPLSLLHLEGPNSASPLIGGWRRWMQTGMYIRDETDAIYLGLKHEGFNRADAILGWSDDPSSNNGGADVFKFVFTAFANSNGNGLGTDPRDGKGLNGYEFMRMAASDYQTNSANYPTGFIGIGPLFTNTFFPQSRMHMHSEDQLPTWLQITNETGTGQTAQDGLRLGIRPNKTAYLRQQENMPFIIQTDWNAGAGGINAGERMRVTTISAPGVPNPAAPFIANTTRVSISHQGTSPVTAPRSLLHLGYNTGINSVGGTSTDGWRDWMDIGTFTSNGTDNMYVGLKRETGAFPANDRQDAVINWGDNDAANPFNGPDNLRFIFTSTTTGLNTNPPSNTNNGLEVARMSPALASTLAAPNYGMMGVGNFYNAGIPPIDAKLDIDGDLRIRQVTQQNSTKVLVIDSSDLNRVHWMDASNLGGSGIGNFCGTPQNPLSGNYEIPLNNFNYYFTDPAGPLNHGDNFVKIGDDCTTPIVAKLEVHRGITTNTQFNVIGALVRNEDDALNTINTGFGYGVVGTATGPNEQNAGIGGTASNAATNYGGYFLVNTPFVSPTENNNNTGVRGIAGNANINVGGRFETSSTNVATNYGIRASANGAAGSTDLAGWFDGDVQINGNLTATTGTISDQQFKKNIDSISNVFDIIAQLKPKTFDFDTASFPQFNFSNKKQYGLIAQEVEQILPELVLDKIFPEQYDSLGNQTAPAIPFKTLNYQEFIPILIAGMQEQQSDIDSLNNVLALQDSINNNLENRLLALENCVAEANLCNTDSKLVNDNTNNIGQSIELSNLNAIILDQNLPNPFAENTTISYVIPDDVMNAQLLFYDMNGRIIKQVEINERGNGKLTVYGENLQKGIYTYSLIADGKLIATKKMVKQ